MDKKGYQIPTMRVTRFETEDVLSASSGGGNSGGSGGKDENQGEWDPQVSRILNGRETIRVLN